MKVYGRCPMGCGETLMLGNGGHVTCSYLPCPDPCKADDLLEHSENVQQLLVSAESAVEWLRPKAAA